MLCYKDKRGYTLTELIIVMTIGVILIAGAYATYITQNRSYNIQENVSEVNTQSKIAHDMIANNIRGAGFGIPEDLNTEPINGYTAIINPVDNTNSSDAITVVGGFRLIGTLWPPGVGPGTPCPLSVPMGSTQIRIIYSGTAAPNTTDRRFLNIDGVEFVEVQNCNIPVGSTDCDNSTITIDRPLIQDFPLMDTDGDGLCDTGRPVYLVEDITFCVDGNLTLRKISRNANPNTCTGVAASDNDAIAENIEDLQFAYAVDNDGDGQTDDLNGDGVIDSGDFINGVGVNDPSNIVAVRINILARSNRPDVDYRGLGNPPAQIENRNHNPTNDDFRRRWWQTTVKVRNRL